jgi:hypothetical protein
MRTLLDIIVFWCLASLIFGCLWAFIGYRRNSASEPETDFSWEGHAFRIVELHPDDFDRLLTKEEAARRVG